jgi:hypothetical protein
MYMEMAGPISKPRQGKGQHNYAGVVYICGCTLGKYISYAKASEIKTISPVYNHI